MERVELQIMDVDESKTYTLMVSPEDHTNALKEHKRTFNDSSSTVPEPGCSYSNSEYLDFAESEHEENNENDPDSDIDDIEKNKENDCNQSTARNNRCNKRQYWSDKETLLLLALYKEYDEAFSAGLMTHRHFWRKIVNWFKDQGYSVTVSRCVSKMETLKRIYKKVKDHNNQSGNDKKSCNYYEELDDLFRTKPWIKPLSMAGSNIALPEVLLELKTINKSTNKRTFLEEQTMEYFEKCLEEKRSKREQTEVYRKEKLRIMEEMMKSLKKS